MMNVLSPRRITVLVVSIPTVVLRGPRVVIRPGRDGDAARLHAIRGEPEVARWWRTPEPVEQIHEELRGGEYETQFVVQVDGTVAGLVQYAEEDEPDYRHASIDLFLATAFHGTGLGTETVAVMATYLVDHRGHHRLTIDPAAHNARAIRAYAKVGFAPVGRMREYERGQDGTWHDALLMDLLARDLVRVPLVVEDVTDARDGAVHTVTREVTPEG